MKKVYNNNMSKIELKKISSIGKELVWKGEVNGNTITVCHGQVGGKIQTKKTVIKSGKNIGRSNETTPQEQALQRLETMAVGKIENGYELVGSYTFTTVKVKQRKEQDKSIPAPMLAHKAEDHEKKIINRTIAIQPKLDGFRAIYSVKRKKLYSRSRKELIGCPHIIEELSKISFPKDMEYIDGELYTDSLTFEEVSKIVSPRKTINTEIGHLIQYHVFDHISDKDFINRIREVHEVLKDTSDAIQLVPTVTVSVGPSLKDSLLPTVEKYIEAGYEGLMVRALEGKYENKRSYTLYKYKLFQDLEAICVGFNSEKDDETVLGSIRFIINGGEFNARPAMTVEQRAYIFANQKEFLGKLGVIKHQEMTTVSDEDHIPVPRFPVFKAWRPKWDLQ